MAKFFHDTTPLHLEAGGVLSEVTIAYDTLGERNADDSNIIWVCHALTASSDVESWWPEMIGKGKLLDSSRYFIICANFFSRSTSIIALSSSANPHSVFNKSIILS